jgi:RHS repeat-associated protein
MTSRRAAKWLGGLVVLSGLAVGAKADAEPLGATRGPGVYEAPTSSGEVDNGTGAMRYGIPFPLSPARGAYQPSLGLSYSSSATDREAGYGWGLDLPMIERRALSGWPKYNDDTDRFYFNGQRLVQVCVAGSENCPAQEVLPGPEVLGASDCRYYRQEIESSFARFFFCEFRHEWVVQLQSGVEMHFGSANLGSPTWGGDMAADGEPDYPTHIARYKLSWTKDVHGNEVVYRWRKLGGRGLSYLTDIFDTESAVGPSGTKNVDGFAHHTQLDWEPVPYATTRYAKIERAKPDMRLTRVASASAPWLGGARRDVHGWRLSYLANRNTTAFDRATQAPLWHHSFLKQVQQFGCTDLVEGGSSVIGPTSSCPGQPATTMEYEGQKFIAHVQGVPDFSGPLAFDATVPFPSDGKPKLRDLGSVALVDMNRDGLPDLVQSWWASDLPRVDPITGQTVQDPAALRDVQTTLIGERTVPHYKAHRAYMNAFANASPQFKISCVDTFGGDLCPAGYRPDGHCACPNNQGGVCPTLRFNTLATHVKSEVLNGSPVATVRPASFLDQRKGATVLGPWGDAPALWSDTGLCPVFPEVPPQPLVLSNGCYQDEGPAPGPQLASFSWVAENERGRHWVDCGGAAGANPEAALFVDVDGDGYPDRIAELAQTGDQAGELSRGWVHFTRRTLNGTTAKLKPFSEWSDPADARALRPQSTSAHSAALQKRHLYADLDGDGQPDFIEFPANVATGWADGPPKLFPGDGHGQFSCENGADVAPCGSVALPSSPMSSTSLTFQGARMPWSNYTWPNSIYVADVTGDGLADVLQVELLDGSGVVRLWVNEDGRTLRCPTADCVVARLSKPNGSRVFDQARVTFADIDADGLNDLLVMAPEGVWKVQLFQSPLRPDQTSQRASHQGLLTKIDNGRGKQTLVLYQTVQELDQAATHDGHPWVYHSPQVFDVVTRVAELPGADLEYTYENPAFDPWERRAMGFRKITTKSSDQPARTESIYWFSACHQEIINAAGCAQGSEGDGRNGRSGKLVLRNVLIPGVPNVRPDQWLSSTSFQYRDLLIDTGSPPLPSSWQAAPGVQSNPLVRVRTIEYDPNVPVIPGALLQAGEDDAIPISPTQPGVARAFLKDYRPNYNTGFVYEERSYGAQDQDTPNGPHVVRRELESPMGNARWQMLVTEERSGGDGQTIGSGPGAGMGFKHVTYSRNSFGDVILVSAYHETLSTDLDRGFKIPGQTVAISPSSPGPGLIPIAQFDYDSWGNLIHSEGPGSPGSPGLPGSPGACADIEFDGPFRQFPQATHAYVDGCGSAELQTAYIWNRAWAKPTYTQAPDLSETLVAYDALGRPTHIDRPVPDQGGSAQSVSFAYQDGAPSKVRTVRALTGTANEETVTVFNGHGSVDGQYQRAASGEAGAWVAETVLQRRGDQRVIEATKPYFTNYDPWTGAGNGPGYHDALSYTYDNFGRVSDAWESTAGGSLRRIQEITRTPARVRVRDAKQIAGAPGYTETFTDGFGRPTRVSTQGAQLVDELYAYTGTYMSEVTITRGSGGQTSARTMTFDTLGRMVKNDEPNTSANGHSLRYVWDAAGRLIGTSDARGCGKNLFYDGLGRLKAEDFSPCEAHHAPYTEPNLVTGEGTEAFFLYDMYEPGQTSPTWDYSDEERHAVGRLVSVRDRGSHTRFNYDNRGRVRRTSRRIAQPGVPNEDLALRYASHWYAASANYDLGDRLTQRSTGIDIPEMQKLGESRFSYGYDVRGNVRQITSSYGTILQSASYLADGRTDLMQYGTGPNTQPTSVDFAYDMWNRLELLHASRSASALWNGPAVPGVPGYSLPGSSGTKQTSLLQLQMTYDDVGNPLTIVDGSTSSWANGAKPASRTMTYDNSYRLTSVSTVYNGGTSYLSPFNAERTAGDRAPVPLRNATSRPTSQTFNYNWRGNITSSADNLNLRYDRSLGTAGFSAQRPDQMTSAAGMAMVYDEAGNLVELKVQRSGTCSVGSSSFCAQRYRYDWDEVGQLQRARRWDYVSTIPAAEAVYPAVPVAAPVQDLDFSYSLGKRVRKSSAVSALNTVEVFDTLRLSGSYFRYGDYDNEQVNVTGYLAGGMARVESMSAAPSPTNNPVHMLLQIGDHLGSTGVVIDWETAEVVEKATYMPYGAIESDYRPTRWQSFREEYKFTGKEEDIEVGLTYFGARYYHARLGRFISPDPLTVHMAAADPNPYAYVRGRTMSQVDPLGLKEPPPDSTDIQEHANNEWSAISRDGTIEYGTHNPHQGILDGALGRLSEAVSSPIGRPEAHVVPTHVWGHSANLASSVAHDSIAMSLLLGGAPGSVAAAVHSSAPQMPVASEPGDVSLALPIVASVLVPSGPATAGAKAGTVARAAGRLRAVARGIWESAAGLRYGPGSAQGNRVLHVLEHAADIPGRAGAHGVFAGGRSAVLGTIDSAYQVVRGGGPGVTAVQQGARTVYTVPMGRTVGYVGGRSGAAAGNPAASHIRLVLEGINVITAFPVIP